MTQAPKMAQVGEKSGIQPEQIIFFGPEVEYTAQRGDNPVLLIVAPDNRRSFNLESREVEAQNCLINLNTTVEIVITTETLTRQFRTKLQGALENKIWTKGRILYKRALAI